MRSFAIALLVSVACGSPATTPATRTTTQTTPPAALDPVLGKRLDAVIDKALAEQQVVGVVVLVARDGKLVYSRAAGMADREAKHPMREDTVFRLASMTKPIVSVAALALVDQGKLKLDDPVTKYLPDFRPKLADGREPVITIRHLLTHTSGLTYTFLEKAGGPYHKAEVSDGLAEPGLAADVNLRRLASAPLLAEPGTKWQYSLSVDVLGEAIAKADGSSLPEVVKRTITRPLEMIDTTFSVTDRDRLAWPYGAGKPPVRMTEPYELTEGDMTLRYSPARIFDSGSFASGGAGMAGTVSDYLKFCEALRTGGAPILRPETARGFAENQVAGGDALGPGNGFGFGVGVIDDPAKAKSPRGPGSWGWGGAYGTYFHVDPQAKMSVVIFTNVAGDTPFPGEFEKALYGS